MVHKWYDSSETWFYKVFVVQESKPNLKILKKCLSFVCHIMLLFWLKCADLNLCKSAPLFKFKKFCRVSRHIRYFREHIYLLKFFVYIYRYLGPKKSYQWLLFNSRKFKIDIVFHVEMQQTKNMLKAMDQEDHVTKFLQKFVLDNIFILQNVFLEIWKIQQKTIKNVSQLRLNKNLAKNFTVNCNCRNALEFFSKILPKKQLTDVLYCLLLRFPIFQKDNL